MPDETAPNLSRLIKLLKMTTSPNDGEAVTAMRMANVEVSKFGGDWETILRGKITIIADPFANDAIPEPRPYNGRGNYAPPPPPQPAPQAHPQPPYTPYAPHRPQPAPRPRGYPQPNNSYPGHCYCCGTYVKAFQGTRFRPTGPSGRWEVQCTNCLTTNVPIPARRAKPAKQSLSDIANMI